jgi:hypothetical protein
MTNKYTYSPPFTKDELLKDYSSGMTQNEIAVKYHTSQKVVWRAMINYEIKSRPAVKRNQYAENNTSWKGNNATYKAYHIRVKVIRGQPKKCEICGTDDVTKTYDWANLTGNFADPSDYKRMCRSCHWKHDNKIANLGTYGRKKEVQNAC